MQSLDTFLSQYIGENGLPKYLYNCQKFEPGKTPVFYSGPYWDEAEIQAAMKVFLGGNWLVSGPAVEAFQKKFSKQFNHKFSHMVNSGSSANLVMIGALKETLGWSKGDEVLVSTVGFPTTVAPLVQHQLQPVFVDIEWETLNFDLEQLEAQITPRTKAIFVSPVLGNPPDMDKLQEIARRYSIELVGDNCDSLGTKWHGEHLTDLYIASSCSFYPAHHITTGEGGMVSSNRKDIMDVTRSLSWWGRDCYCVGAANLLAKGSCGKRFDKWLPEVDTVLDHKYVFSHLGYNLKPLDLQGAIGSVQLDKFDEIHLRRRRSKEAITNIVKETCPEVKVVEELQGAETSWFGTPLVCPDKELKTRLVQHLEKNKIQTRNYFAGNILLHPAYREFGDYRKYPMANRVLDEVFFLGAAPHYETEVFDYIHSVFRAFK